MKTKIAVFIIYFVSCFFVFKSASQITSLSEEESNAEKQAQIVQSNANWRTEYRQNNLSQQDLEIKRNILSHAGSAKPWPEPSKKQEVFQHNAEVVRFCMNTNQFEWICKNIATNFPAVRRFQNKFVRNGPIVISFVTNELVISHIGDFSSMVISNLELFANELSNSNLDSFVGVGYEATISNNTNFFLFNFWPNESIRSIEMRSADAKHILLQADLFESGKLAGFKVLSPPQSVTFDADGKLISYCSIENNLSIDLRQDEAGKLIMRGFLVKRP